MFSAQQIERSGKKVYVYPSFPGGGSPRNEERREWGVVWCGVVCLLVVGFLISKPTTQSRLYTGGDRTG